MATPYSASIRDSIELSGGSWMYLSDYSKQPQSDEKRLTQPEPTPIVVLDWDSPNDPDNPKNWPLWKRILHSFVPAVYSFVLCTAISTYVAAIPFIQLQFSVSRNMAILPVSLYTIGFMIGPCIASPISELYGRRWIYWSNYPMLVLFNGLAVVPDNFTALCILRFLAGAGGSGVLAVGAGTLSDVWEMKYAGTIGVAYILAPFLGPTLGPLIGAYVLHQYNYNWKWAAYVVLCILAPLGIGIAMMQETSKTIILQWKAEKRGITPTTEPGYNKTKALFKGLLRPLHMLIFEPLSLLLALYSAFSFAMIFSFFGSYNYVYTKIYHFDQRQIGLCYIPVIVGFLFAVATFGIFDKLKYQKEAVRTNNHVAPEFRLYSALFGCWLVPIGLFWYAWTPREGVHWAVPVMAGFPFGWGSLGGFLSCLSYIVETYGPNSASGVAANGIVRFAFCAAFPQFIIQLYDSSIGIHWAGTIFAIIGVLMIPVPWYFFYKGRSLREKSHYPTNPN